MHLLETTDTSDSAAVESVGNCMLQGAYVVNTVLWHMNDVTETTVRASVS